MKPNFKRNRYQVGVGFVANNATKWAEENHIETNWCTPEQIDVRPVYTQDDLEGMEHLHMLPVCLLSSEVRIAQCIHFVLGHQYAGFSQ